MSKARGLSLWLLVTGAALCGAPDATAQDALADGVQGEGSLDPPERLQCISPQQWREVQARVSDYLRQRGPYPPVGGPALLPQYPQAGIQGKDIYLNNYVDLDVTGGILSWTCAVSHTYDGHRGSDMIIRSFDEQDDFVPIYSALHGTVIDWDDGHFDKETVIVPGTPANYVTVDHGAGRIGYYWHMKKGSVLVQRGDLVKAGQQIGSVGSSGMSNWPHLHLGVQDGGVSIEPFEGGCNPGRSAWVAQMPHSKFLGMNLQDFTFLRSPPVQPPGNQTDRTGQIDLNDTSVYFLTLINNRPANSGWQVEFIDPGGTTYTTRSGTFAKTGFFSFFWVSFKFGVSNNFNQTGTWTVRYSIDGTRLVDAPLVVNDPFDPTLARAPATVTATLDPAAPNACQPLRCGVSGDPVLDDLDYDVVSYRYEWKVDGAVARDVTVAARADQLPAQPAGSVVTVDVTPTDGTLTAATTTATETVMASPLTLDIQRDAATGGDWVTFSVCDGMPTGPLLLYVTGVGGVPFTFRLLGGSFDGNGKYVFSPVVPAGLASVLVDFAAIGVDPVGALVVSNKDSVQF